MSVETIGRINALYELQHYGLKYEARGDTEVMFCCPVHEETTPSASLNVEKHLWKCHSATCGKSGDLISLLAYHVKKDRGLVLADLYKRYPELDSVKTVPLATVEKWHDEIWKSGPLLKALRDRGITDAMIRKARLGYYDGRITIPVYDEYGKVVNVRKYLPGAPSVQKMKNLKGYKALALYQVDQTSYDKVWVCGGEMKALVAGSLLNPHGIGAVSATGGEGAWDNAFSMKLQGKTVYVCMDIDPGGIAAGRRVAIQLVGFAKEVRIVALPLDPDKHPKGDLNDFVGNCGAGAAELLSLQETAVLFSLTDSEEAVVETVEVSLAQSIDSTNVSKNLLIEAIPQALDETPYLVPKKLSVKCTRDQKNCIVCPVMALAPDPKTSAVELTIKNTSQSILRFVGESDTKQKIRAAEAVRIPACSAAEIEIKDFYSVSFSKLGPQISLTGDNEGYVSQPAYLVDLEVDLNSPYKFSARLCPHPKTQQAVLLVQQASKSRDSLTDFELSAENVKALEIFQGEPEHTLNKIYEDLSKNITRIYRRPEIHLLIDLVFHSPPYITFEDDVHKGWVNALLMGDSSQGKSEASQMLMRHYGLGERTDCKNASAAGLIGGVSSIGQRNIIQWGVIPVNDRRLVVLEEVKGLSVEMIGRMTDMRSSGVAEIGKIERRRSHARTRLLWISNPRSARPIGAFSFGVEAISELIGGPEDVRRFDCVAIVAANQISLDGVDKSPVQHTYTSDLCRTLILWAWTRRPEQVRFTSAATNLIITETKKLCQEYCENIPIIDAGTTRHKIARLSAALAARLFSTDREDPSILVIHHYHVMYITKFLRRLYSDKVMGYLEYSNAVKFISEIQDPEAIRLQIAQTKHPEDLMDQLLRTDDIGIDDICNWCELSDYGDARGILSLLVRKSCLVRTSRNGYRKTPGFIEYLRKLRNESLKHDTPEGDM